MFKSRIIASVKDDISLDIACNSSLSTIFLLYGDINSLEDIIKKIKKYKKKVYVNIDLINGLASNISAVKFLIFNYGVDGLLTSKPNLAKTIKDNDIKCILRCFMIDSFSYDQILKKKINDYADYLEIMPGCIPSVISWVHEQINIPIIAGGLICTTKDLKIAFNNGASYVATSNKELWLL